MRTPRAVLAGALAAVAVLGGTAAATAAPIQRAMTNGPCGWSDQPPRTFSHVVLVVMENRSFEEIIGNSNAPRINALAQQCGLETNYHHVGSGNGDKIMMTSGSTWGLRTSG